MRDLSALRAPRGDEGSGAWLGLEAVRLMLHRLDGRGVRSPLLESVYAHSAFVDGFDRLPSEGEATGSEGFVGPTRPRWSPVLPRH